MPPAATPVPAGIPKTGQMSEHMARVAAQNVAADVQGGERRRLPMSKLEAIGVLDAGNSGIIFTAENVLTQDSRAHIMAGPQAHWAKLAFERYFLASRRRGFVKL